MGEMNGFVAGLHPDMDEARDYVALGMGQSRVPRRHERRFELIETSNQGQTSECAAYAKAGLIEHRNWKYLDIYGQTDPHQIYAGAKETDGISGDGTTLHAVIQAAHSLGLTPKPRALRSLRTISELMRALHRHDVVLGAYECTENWSSPGPDGMIRPGGRRLGGHAVLICAASLVKGDAWIGHQGSWGWMGFAWHGFSRLSLEAHEEQWIYGVAVDYGDI